MCPAAARQRWGGGCRGAGQAGVPGKVGQGDGDSLVEGSGQVGAAHEGVLGLAIGWRNSQGAVYAHGGWQWRGNGGKGYQSAIGQEFAMGWAHRCLPRLGNGRH